MQNWISNSRKRLNGSVNYLLANTEESLKLFILALIWKIVKHPYKIVSGNFEHFLTSHNCVICYLCYCLKDLSLIRFFSKTLLFDEPSLFPDTDFEKYSQIIAFVKTAWIEMIACSWGLCWGSYPSFRYCIIIGSGSPCLLHSNSNKLIFCDA